VDLAVKWTFLVRVVSWPQPMFRSGKRMIVERETFRPALDERAALHERHVDARPRSRYHLIERGRLLITGQRPRPTRWRTEACCRDPKKKNRSVFHQTAAVA